MKNIQILTSEKDSCLKIKLKYKAGLRVKLTLPDGKPGLKAISEDNKTQCLLLTEYDDKFQRERIQISIFQKKDSDWIPKLTFATNFAYLWEDENNLKYRKSHSQEIRTLFKKIMNSLPDNFTEKQIEEELRKSDRFKVPISH